MIVDRTKNAVWLWIKDGWGEKKTAKFCLRPGLFRRGLRCCQGSCKPKSFSSVFLCFSSVFSYHAVQLWQSAAHHHVSVSLDFLSIKAFPLAVYWSLFRSSPGYSLNVSPFECSPTALLQMLLLPMLTVWLLAHKF